LKEITEIQSISFVGSGNVATHLAHAFQSADRHIHEVYSPHHSHALDFARKFNCVSRKSIQQLSSDVDLMLLCVPDSQISEVSELILPGRAIVAHTSGIEPLASLSDKIRQTGVFYPLQTFSKDRKVDFRVVPLCIEGKQASTFELLTQLAYKLSNKVVAISSPERAMLHLTAVMVNNFSNKLYGMAHEILERNQLDFNLLLPLIQETAHKMEEMSPEEAQTGPARRNDENTISRHREMLKEFPQYQQLYQLITDEIIKKTHE